MHQIDVWFLKKGDLSSSYRINLDKKQGFEVLVVIADN